MKPSSLVVFVALAGLLICCPPFSRQSLAGDTFLGEGLAPQETNPLTISLSVDKTVVRPRDEILFTESFKNCGKKPYSVYDDGCYRGDDLKIVSASDPKSVIPTGGTPFGHTVKPGARPADVVLLQPGEVFKREFAAYVTSDYRMIFQADRDTVRQNKYRKLPNVGKEYEEVPQRFLGCGRVFSLGKPGSYKISARYDNDQKWITRKQSTSPLWVGHVYAPEITIKVSP